MKTIKLTFTLLSFTLMLSAMSCNEGKYSELEDGLYAEIVINGDTLVAQLFYEKAPVTVANFVALSDGNHPMTSDVYAGKPFYKDLIFHRIMDGFMIQGGDPEGSGRGGPGYKFGDEFDDTLRHSKPGILSMANSGPNANGSQFFITDAPTPWLDNVHSIFGELVLGFNELDSISAVEVTPGSNKPVEDVVINEVNIIRIGFDARKFDAVYTWETELRFLEERQAARMEDARIKAEETKAEAEQKMVAAAAETLPILEDYKSKTEASPSGLLTYIITEGTGANVKQGDNVTVNYEGYFTDGKLFDSNNRELEEKYGKLNEQKIQRGMYDPMPMVISPDAQMIAGFKEAAANMKVGEKKYIYIPSHLAYGERGRGMIQPNTDLVFILEMVAIQ